MKKSLLISAIIILSAIFIKICFYPSVSRKMFCDNFALNSYAFGMASNTLESKQGGYDLGYFACLNYTKSYRGILDLELNKIHNNLTIHTPSPWVDKIQRQN